MTDPRPGSPEAIERGCECPRIDNAHGAGIGGDGERFGWWIDSECPVHASETEERDDAD